MERSSVAAGSENCSNHFGKQLQRPVIHVVEPAPDWCAPGSEYGVFTAPCPLQAQAEMPRSLRSGGLCHGGFSHVVDYCPAKGRNLRATPLGVDGPHACDGSERAQRTRAGSPCVSPACQHCALSFPGRVWVRGGKTVKKTKEAIAARRSEGQSWGCLAS